MVITHINHAFTIRRRAKLAGMYPSLIGRRYRSIRARSEARAAAEAAAEMVVENKNNGERLACRDPYCPNYSPAALFVCPLNHGAEPEGA